MGASMRIVRRIAVFAFVLLVGAVGGNMLRAQDLPTNLRMQNVVKEFVARGGADVVGMGSWIRGNYGELISDHDMRLVMPQGTSESRAIEAWQQAKDDLARLIRSEFGDDAAQILNRTNLYPPSQLMSLVETSDEAMALFRRVQTVPSLGHSGAVTANTNLARYAEGLYGEGSKAFIQDYERSAGRLFYSRNGNGYMGATDLTHFSEGLPRYTVCGMTNTGAQWADKIRGTMRRLSRDNAIEHAKDVAKYLRRLDRDLHKARDLVNVGADDAWRGKLRTLAEQLRQYVSKGDDAGAFQALQNNSGYIDDIVWRAERESWMLQRYIRAGRTERGILELALEPNPKRSKLVEMFDDVYKRLPGGTWEVTLNSVFAALVVHQTATVAGEEGAAQALRSALPVLADMNLPNSIMVMILNAALDASREAGFAFVAGAQDPWDMMEGVYTGIGRAGVDDPSRSYSLEDLVRQFHFDDEGRLEALVAAKAHLAADRGYPGQPSEDDWQVAEKIFENSWPVIRQAWHARLSQHLQEFRALTCELSQQPLLITYLPSPPEIDSDGQISVRAVINPIDDRLKDIRQQMRAILDKVDEKGSFELVTYRWDGGTETGEEWQRDYGFRVGKDSFITAKVEIAIHGNSIRGNSPFNAEVTLPAAVDVYRAVGTWRYRVKMVNAENAVGEGRVIDEVSCFPSCYVLNAMFFDGLAVKDEFSPVYETQTPYVVLLARTSGPLTACIAGHFDYCFGGGLTPDEDIDFASEDCETDYFGQRQFNDASRCAGWPGHRFVRGFSETKVSNKNIKHTHKVLRVVQDSMDLTTSDGEIRPAREAYNITGSDTYHGGPGEKGSFPVAVWPLPDTAGTYKVTLTPESGFYATFCKRWEPGEEPDKPDSYEPPKDRRQKPWECEEWKYSENTEAGMVEFLIEVLETPGDAEMSHMGPATPQTQQEAAPSPDARDPAGEVRDILLEGQPSVAPPTPSTQPGTSADSVNDILGTGG